MIGARIMLIIVIINFITMIIQGEARGGRVMLHNDPQTIISYVFIIIVLFYLSFKDFSKDKGSK